MIEAVTEIRIERAFLMAGADASDLLRNSDPGEGVIHVRDVLEQMDAAWLRGCRALVLSVDSGGGEVQAGIVLYDALRAWRAAGGVVVAYLGGIAASTMSWAPLAADLVVAKANARITVHGAHAGLPAWVTDAKRAIYCTGTTAPRQVVEAWITASSHPGGQGCVGFDAHQARGLGLIDEIGNRSKAHALAKALSRGSGSSGRRAVQVKEGSEFAPVFANLSAAAQVLRNQLNVRAA